MKNKATLLTVLLFALCVQLGFAQSRTISGVVKDASTGETLPGVAVIEKGTSNGTSTNVQGKFDLTVKGENPVLVFKAIGMSDKEVTVGSENFIVVNLDQSSEQLQEVVVTALGFEIPKERAGSASTNVGGDLITNTGDTRLINNLSGKSAGLNIVQSTGDPGAGSYVQIRGQTSITGDLQPLIILDGIPISNEQFYGEAFGGNQSGSSGSLGSGGGVTQQSRLNDINPNDIESVEILRGAAAAALWGSRAANGVMVITTKKGTRAAKGGRTFNVNVNASLSFDQINRKVPLNTTYGQGNNMVYTQGAPASFARSLSWGDKIANRPGGTDTYITDPTDPNYMGFFVASDGTRYYRIPDGDQTNPNGGKNSTATYDPYDALFKIGSTFDKSISISSADDKGTIYLSLGNLYQDGIIKNNSDYDKTTLNLNMTRFLGDKWTVKGGANYTYSNSNRVQMGSNLNGILLGGLRSPADFNQEHYVGDYTDAAGNTFTDVPRAFRNALGANPGYGYDNPLWIMDNILSTSRVNRLISKLEFNYEPVNWLNLTLRGGSDQYTDEREDIYDALSAGTNNGGRFIKGTITSQQWNLDLIARFRAQINENIDFNGLVGGNFNQRRWDDYGTDARTFINAESPPQLANASNVLGFNQEESQRQVGYYMQASFGLYEQLFVNLSSRLDYLSTLPEDNNSIFYPAIDAAWNFSKVLPDIPFLSSTKLRAGWGQVGRGPDPYITQTGFISPTANIAGYGEGWGPGVNPTAYGGAFVQTNVAGNPDIKPEIKTEWEIGTDLGFFNDRLGLSFTYYSNTVKDLIIQVDVPNATGFESQVDNVAELENKGIELELNANIYKKGDFRWDSYLNYTRNRNQVTNMGGTEYVLLAGFAGTSSGAMLNQPVGVLRGAIWDRNADGSLILDDNGFPTQAAVPGVIGDPNPDFRMGFGNTVSYKNWSLNLLLDMSVGGDMWNGTKGALAFFGKAEYTATETTLSAADAAALNVFAFDANGNALTVADVYPHAQNADGSYTVRGEVKDFGGGNVFLDENYYTSGPGSGFTGPDEQFIEDASWYRLRELRLSYNLTSQKFKDWSRLKGATVSLIGNNLFLWTDYEGNDPNQSLNGPGNNGNGLDYFQNPSTRSYAISVNLSF